MERTNQTPPCLAMLTLPLVPTSLHWKRFSLEKSREWERKLQNDLCHGSPLKQGEKRETEATPLCYKRALILCWTGCFKQNKIGGLNQENSHLSMHHYTTVVSLC